ncbi:MAG: family 10 glycosylhydrolase [Planctomycetes bacterium]|nr:family 10 glycosylhydrolase [Planctomycetota bacterium]
MNRFLFAVTALLSAVPLAGETSATEKSSSSPTPTPRGQRRLLYVSDPSSIASNLFPDPVHAEDLRRWVDMLADSGIDTFNQEVYNQCWTNYWRSKRFEYDPRPQHRRFLPLLEKGTQPLAILIDQSHKRGLTFIAGFRMNDNHGGISQFVRTHPEWVLREFPEGELYKASKPLDFTFAGPRDYVHDVIAEVVSRFDVDGIELCFRDHAYFPVKKGRAKAHLMTDLVRRIRATLDEAGKAKKKKLLLGARVFSTLEECQDLGLDVPSWITKGLIDYLCPQDVMFADFNAPYAEFARLTRRSPCMLYPALLPWTSARARNRLDQIPLSPASCRALAHTFYNAGADGLSVYNHFTTMWHAPFYPQALRCLRSLRDPARVAAGERHYLFDPTWGGLTYFGLDRASTGAVRANRIVLERAGNKTQGDYPFWLFEDLRQGQSATLLFRGFNLSNTDELRVTLNGKAIPAQAVRLIGRGLSEQGRIDFRKGGEPKFSTRWFELGPSLLVWGQNKLSVALKQGDPKASGPIVIDEVEVFVQP